MILPIVYAGNIAYFNLLIQANEPVFLDGHEHSVKQSYRNRTEIYGANGKLSLIIPLIKRNQRTPMNEVIIDYRENWQKLHWKSMEAAYRSSPYFEYYEHKISPFFSEKKYEKLVDFNLAFMETILGVLGETPRLGFTVKYEEVKGVDYRQELHPKRKLKEQYPKEKYMQVFDNKYGFIENLSVLDLLFNEGPNAINFLR